MNNPVGTTDKNLEGKTCLITGANSGLGLATVKRFARLSADVILVCRDRERGQRAVDEVRAEVPDSKLELMICDLASTCSVRRFAVKFKEAHDRLDVLFNNAAALKVGYTTTQDGLETMFHVNCLAPFLLIEDLIGPLRASPDPRIINIAAPRKSLRLDMENTQNPWHFSPLPSFFQTKLWLAILSVELSRRLSGQVSVYVTEPGPGKFKSSLTRELPAALSFLMDLFAKTADHPAKTIEFLAAVDDPDKGAGKIFFGKRARAMPSWWTDAEIGRKVWTAIAALSTGIGAKRVAV